MTSYRFPAATKAAADTRRIARQYLKRMQRDGQIPAGVAVSVRYSLCGHTPSIDCIVSGPQAWCAEGGRWPLTAKFIGEQVESIRIHEIQNGWYGGTTVIAAEAAKKHTDHSLPPSPVATKPSMTFADLVVGDEVLMAVEIRTTNGGRQLSILRRFVHTRFARCVASVNGFVDYYGIRCDFDESEEVNLGRYRPTQPVIAIRHALADAARTDSPDTTEPKE